MKPKTYVKAVRFTENMLKDWHYLKSVSVRPADILREAAELALRKKAKQMKIQESEEFLPF